MSDETDDPTMNFKWHRHIRATMSRLFSKNLARSNGEWRPRHRAINPRMQRQLTVLIVRKRSFHRE